MCVMEVSRPAEAHGATQHRSTGEMEFSRFQHDSSVKWAMHIFIGFTQEDSKKRTIFRKIPGLWGWRRFYRGGMFAGRGHTTMEKLPQTVSPISE
jgi:hypothetical protein